MEDHRQRGSHFTESELINILYQLAQGLRYIHSQNLVHLDIKPGMWNMRLIKRKPVCLQGFRPDYQSPSDITRRLATKIAIGFSDFIWLFLPPYKGVIPNQKMAFIFQILSLGFFSKSLKKFPKGKGCFPKSQIKSLGLKCQVSWLG